MQMDLGEKNKIRGKILMALLWVGQHVRGDLGITVGNFTWNFSLGKLSADSCFENCKTRPQNYVEIAGKFADWTFYTLVL
jgi:hypothetical protein